MKKLFCVLIILFTTIYSKVFAEFEFGFQIPLGYGITFYNTSIDYRDTPTTYTPVKITDRINGEVGLLAQAGYNFNFLDTNSVLKGIGLFLDFGYYFYSIGSRQKYYDRETILGVPISIEFSYDEIISFHSINVGIIPKFNFDNYTIGLGGGVRLPISGHQKIYNVYANLTEMDNGGQTENISHSELKDNFKNLVAGYIKYTVEYKFKVKNKRFATMFGTYLLYDFGMSYKLDKLNEEIEGFNGSPYFKKYSYNNFNVGLLFGMYFW